MHYLFHRIISYPFLLMQRNERQRRRSTKIKRRKMGCFKDGGKSVTVFWQCWKFPFLTQRLLVDVHSACANTWIIFFISLSITERHVLLHSFCIFPIFVRHWRVFLSSLMTSHVLCCNNAGDVLLGWCATQVMCFPMQLGGWEVKGNSLSEIHQFCRIINDNREHFGLLDFT